MLDYSMYIFRHENEQPELALEERCESATDFINEFLQILDDNLSTAVGIFSIANSVSTTTDARIQIIASQNQNGNNPNPQQQNNEGSNGAVQHIVA